VREHHSTILYHKVAASNRYIDVPAMLFPWEEQIGHHWQSGVDGCQLRTPGGRGTPIPGEKGGLT